MNEITVAPLPIVFAIQNNLVMDGLSILGFDKAKSLLWMIQSLLQSHPMIKESSVCTNFLEEVIGPFLSGVDG